MKRFPLTTLVLSGVIFGSPMLQARILADDEAAQAPTSTLQQEANIFSSIRMGIALSMAQCEGRDLCSPSVNSNEIKRLLETLDTRIDDLTLKQESVEDPDAFQQVLAIYVDERDNYNSVLEKLGTVEEDIEEIGIESEVVEFEEPELEETLSEDDTFVDEPAETAISDDEFELFQDEDLELEDDEDIDFEDDFDPEDFESEVQ